jgi:phosphoglycerate dehydrogenase-like enzyme
MTELLRGFENANRPTISRRRLFGEAAAAAATVGLASLSQQPARAASAEPDDRPRLPLRVLYSRAPEAAAAEQIQAISPQIKLLSSDRFKDELPTADVVIGKLTPEELAAAKQLRWMQVTSVGVDAVLTPALVASDIILTNTRGCSGPPIAETAIAFMMALTRGVLVAAHNRKWDGFDAKQVELRGLTMGIIGLGGIGREVARRGKALDMRVIAVDAEPMFRERYQMVDELWLVDTHLDQLISQSDVLMSCAPLTPRTKGMIGEKQFANMKNGSYLVNVTRGKIVNTEALLAALQSKKLAGAGLDVTDPEPLPAEHPLWQQPNVIITPHKAGGSQLSGARESALFVENIKRYVNHLPMLNVVDKQKGY